VLKRDHNTNSDFTEAAFGLKAHSGWAVLIVLVIRKGELQIFERSRIELFEEAWAKQPYHAAENLEPAEARRVVKRGIGTAKRIAFRELRSALKRTREAGLEVRSCGLLVGNPMPGWSVDEILAVHFRMHKAEGVLFRDVLAEAAAACNLRFVAVPEKSLIGHAEAVLGRSSESLLSQIASLGKYIGAPWGKDQKDAALAAMIALEDPVAKPR
jgi:hypothetical protein